MWLLWQRDKSALGEMSRGLVKVYLQQICVAQTCSAGARSGRGGTQAVVYAQDSQAAKDMVESVYMLD